MKILNLLSFITVLSFAFAFDAKAEKSTPKTNAPTHQQLAHNEVVQMQETPKLNRGGWLSRIKNRSKLRELAGKIHQRQATYEDLTEYLLKGGNPNTMNNYGVYNPFMNDSEVPVLNYFIAGKITHGTSSQPGWQTDLRPDLIKCLKLLLENGAKANVIVSGPMPRSEDASPLLFASAIGNHEAIQLLVYYGANINMIQEISIGSYGPPLLVAYDNATADLILKAHPDRGVTTKEGYNIVQQLMFSPHYTSFPREVLRRLQWLQSHALKFTWESGSPNDPVTRSVWLQKYAEANKDKNRVPEEAEIWAQATKILEELR